MGAVGNFYPFRKNSIKLIQSDKTIKFFYKKHPGYLFQKDIKEKNIVGKEYYKVLENSKIAITCSTIYKIPIPKIWEMMSTGAMLMVDKMDKIKNSGLKKNFNYVEVNEQNLLNKIHYYLDNSSKRKKIAINGMNFVRSKLNTNVQAKRVGEQIIQIFKNRKYESFKFKLSYDEQEVLKLRLLSLLYNFKNLILKVFRKIFKILILK